MSAVLDERLEAPVSAAALPSHHVEPEPRVKRSIRPIVRRVVIGVLVVVTAWALYQYLAGPLIYEQRQQHLSYSFQHPSPTIRDGDAMGVLQIPTIGVNAVAVEGVDVDHLRGGPAHLAGSALPGDVGLVVVYGHRSTNGSPFASIDKLVKGDTITFQARTGPIVQYVVSEVVRNTSVSSVEFADTDDLSVLALVTSESGWHTREQVVVMARALPVTDVETPTVPKLDDAEPGRGSPIGVDALLANLAAGGAALAWIFLRRRVGVVVLIIVIAPLAMTAALRLMLAADQLLPLAR